MKKIISISAWTFVIITILCLLLTMLSSYNFVNIKYFHNYYVFQLSIIITMFLWSIKQFQIRNGQWVNSIFCMLLGFGAMFFVILKVY
ncbi:hypothetical protein CLHOM_31540 [Clostridium homopropionicum DSM 5847]|uniref:Uncharacterized protein n=1 Tax=Clostridium homopropionicum DSM 5847 TaxID=1121318 RepID=A0A0L6Z5M3_9CLOT|nr:hypothetical protein [Clostridium homopropionicum]KOA18257.1 hypothetical protein CLHOM_31540 [Clostridium homopropionicum DSM 5847]SFF70349.1 hypothetical protein SAMN04488501_101330 [Clostridium homopropionicum]